MPQIEEAQPKYLQIAHYIRDQILRGDLRPGDEVPSERQLAANWKVSRPTAARSLEALSHQGLVEKRQGSGTYVRSLEVNRRARELYGRARQVGKIYTPGEYAVITSAALAGGAGVRSRGAGPGEGSSGCAPSARDQQPGRPHHPVHLVVRPGCRATGIQASGARADPGGHLDVRRERDGTAGELCRGPYVRSAGDRRGGSRPSTGAWICGLDRAPCRVRPPGPAVGVRRSHLPAAPLGVRAGLSPHLIVRHFGEPLAWPEWPMPLSIKWLRPLGRRLDQLARGPCALHRQRPCPCRTETALPRLRRQRQGRSEHCGLHDRPLPL